MIRWSEHNTLEIQFWIETPNFITHLPEYVVVTRTRNEVMHTFSRRSTHLHLIWILIFLFKWVRLLNTNLLAEWPPFVTNFIRSYLNKIFVGIFADTVEVLYKNVKKCRYISNECIMVKHDAFITKCFNTYIYFCVKNLIVRVSN